MNKKLIIGPLVGLLVLGGVYKTVLAKPKDEPHTKVHGEVYVLPKDFLVNLEDGKFAKFNVGLVIPHGSALPAAAGGHGAAPTPPEGFGTMPQEALVRDLVTDTVTGVSSRKLISEEGRKKIKKLVKRRIKAHTDVKVYEVLFTDVAVQ